MSGRKLVGTWSGDIFIDDLPCPKTFSRDTAYVLQDDVHIPTLTVEETICYSARSKMPEGTSKEDINKRVTLLLEMMLSLIHI